MLRFKYETQQCIDEIRLKYPGANGFTMNYPCPKNVKCNCYAIIGDDWKINSHHDHFKTCRFLDKGKYIKGYINFTGCPIKTILWGCLEVTAWLKIKNFNFSKKFMQTPLKVNKVFLFDIKHGLKMTFWKNFTKSKNHAIPMY